MLLDFGGNQFNNGRLGEHAGFDGIRPDIGHNGINLSGNALQGHIKDAGDA
ncbi:hypothetical protein D3C75_1069540 [compost metagenome]